jgi:hypothetical protein
MDGRAFHDRRKILFFHAMEMSLGATVETDLAARTAG